MKTTYASISGALLITLFIGCAQESLAQLPNTNMGKFVHTPGDNQYDTQAQQGRHGAPQPLVFRSPASGSVGILPPTPAPRRADISLDPIAADEPVPPAGFPPMPDRLDLPIAQVASSSGNAWTSSGQSHGGNSLQPTFHQHYGHVPAGAYMQQQTGPASPANPGQQAPSSQDSTASKQPYRHVAAGAYMQQQTGPKADYYSSGSGPVASPPVYRGASAADVRALGKEPGLGQDQTQSPAAPQPIVVNQASTQDLSLPDDDFSSSANRSNRSAMGRGIMYRMMMMPLYGGLTRL